MYIYIYIYIYMYVYMCMFVCVSLYEADMRSRGYQYRNVRNVRIGLFSFTS